MTSPRNILIVEDEAMIAMMLEDLIGDAGHQVAGVAGSCAEALAWLSGNDCDAAILDINLAGEKSWPVADVLARRGIAFAFSSGGDGGIPDAHAHQPSLPKPFQFRDLQAVLATLLPPG